MKRLSVVMLLLVTLLAATALSAHDYSSGHVQIDHPWSRPTPPGVTMGVGYMVINNHGDQAATLVSASSPRAGHVSIHQSKMEDGVMRMLALKDGLVIPAGESVALEPSGYHLMLEQLNSALVADERVPLTLSFDGGRKIEVELTVGDMDNLESEPGHHNHHHH